ncbi:MAG TPA: MBL fold metallo-hydrolase [Steroidobacteraceae bacterium]|nr:MBL fold metallo-hydrolase [Steroidobacteraceae bacterium]
MIRFRQVAGPVAAIALLLAAGAAAAGGAEDAKQPRKPFKIYGNTYYVGSAGYSAVLVTSDYGYVLIDTGPKEIAAQVAANIQQLGLQLNELKAILVSDARPEHAGGIPELQKLSGAQVYTARAGEQKLHSDKPFKDDPREGAKMGAYPLIPQVWVVQDDQLLGVGNVRARAIETPGGAPEGMSWSWDACEGSKCLPAIYAADLEDGKGHKDSGARKSIEASLAKLEAAPCELLLTPRPEDSGGLARLEQAGGKEDALRNPGACKAYVQQVRQKLGMGGG